MPDDDGLPSPKAWHEASLLAQITFADLRKHIERDDSRFEQVSREIAGLRGYFIGLHLATGASIISLLIVVIGWLMTHQPPLLQRAVETYL